MYFRILIGLIILIFGGVALIENLLSVLISPEIVLSLLLLAVGLLSLSYHIFTAKDLFLLILGIVCTAFAIGMAMSQLQVLPGSGGAFFGLGFSAFFLGIYLGNTQRWWAVLPMSFFFVMGVIQLLDVFFGVQDNTLFFLLYFGMGLAFFYLFLTRNDQRRLSWAVYPAIFLMFLSVMQLFDGLGGDRLSWVVGLGLVALGIIQLVRSRWTTNLSNSSRGGGDQ